MKQPNLNVNQVTKVDHVTRDEDLNIMEPGLYDIPVIAGIFSHRHTVFNVLKIANNGRDFVIIVQNPNKETDIRVLFYNNYAQLFERAYDMEDVLYLQEYNIAWSDCIGTGDNAYILNEAYNFWLELVNKYNLSKCIHKCNKEKY